MTLVLWEDVQESSSAALVRDLFFVSDISLSLRVLRERGWQPHRVVFPDLLLEPLFLLNPGNMLSSPTFPLKCFSTPFLTWFFYLLFIISHRSRFLQTAVACQQEYVPPARL